MRQSIASDHTRSRNSETGKMLSLTYPQSLAIPSALAVVLVVASILAPIGWQFGLMLVLAGLASWTLVEYLIHRVVLHGIEPFKGWHLEHHLHPQLPMRIPVLFSLILISALGVVTGLLATVTDHAVPFACGLSLGYVMQEAIHHRLHISTRRPDSWMDLHWYHHNYHHQVDQNAAFGTLTGWWDWIFHTMAPAEAEGAELKAGDRAHGTGLMSHQPGRGQLIGTWLAALVLIGLLGMLREFTDAEYTFASAAIIPVFLVTWAGGFRHGAAISILAALMWVAADVYSGREFREDWIPLLNGLTRLATYCFVVYLTDRVRTLLIRETELSTHDALTGLLNRRAFLEVGELEANRALRYPHPVAVIFIDLDNFKLVNDRRGHAAGDAALKAVSGALKKSLRATDTVARLGGDEFAVILPETDLRAATAAGNKIAGTMSAALANFPPVTASLGVAWFEKQGESFAAMLKAADALMYEMKQEGKGGIRLRSFA